MKLILSKVVLNNQFKSKEFLEKRHFNQVLQDLVAFWPLKIDTKLENWENILIV